MILDPHDTALLRLVAKRTRFRKGQSRRFLGERVSGPGGTGYVAGQIGVNRLTAIKLLDGGSVSEDVCERARDYARRLREAHPELIQEPGTHEPRIGKYTRSQWIRFAEEMLNLDPVTARRTFDYMNQ